MRILLVCPNPPYDGIFGGGVVMIKNIADILIKRGHEFHVLSEKRKKSYKESEIIAGVHVHRYSFLNIPKIRVFTNPRALYKRIKKIIKESKIDVLIANGPWYDGYVCTKISKEVGIPTLIIIHCPLSTMSVFSGPLKKKAIYAINNCTKIMTVSRHLKKDAVENFCLKPNKIFVNYHGIDNTFLNTEISDKKKFEIKKKYELPREYPVITCLSRFGYPQKRQDILLRAGITIKKHYPGFKMVFIGSGNSSRYQEVAKSVNVHENSLFLESIDTKEVVDLLASSDVFVFPTDFEGFGLVTIEAMAMGLPVIASNVPPLDEIIKDGFNGKLVDNKPEAFAKEIIKLLKNKGKMRTFSKNARKSAVKFTWEKASRNIERELELLVVKK